MALTLAGLEIEKTSGYWRAKGFKQPGILERLEPRQPGGCKLKTAPVRPVVAARPAEYVCSEDLFY